MLQRKGHVTQQAAIFNVDYILINCLVFVLKCQFSVTEAERSQKIFTFKKLERFFCL